MSRITTTHLSLTALLAVAGGAHAATTEPPADTAATTATVSFAAPGDGDHVAGRVALTMAAEGITIEPAGDVHEGAGHFHVIADRGCLDAGASIVKDNDHVHFGGGQTDGFIYLEPGVHELCLQIGDGVHLAQDVTASVSVDVGIDNVDEWCAVIGQVDEMFSTVDGSDDGSRSSSSATKASAGSSRSCAPGSNSSTTTHGPMSGRRWPGRPTS